MTDQATAEFTIAKPGDDRWHVLAECHMYDEPHVHISDSTERGEFSSGLNASTFYDSKLNVIVWGTSDVTDARRVAEGRQPFKLHDVVITQLGNRAAEVVVDGKHLLTRGPTTITFERGEIPTVRLGLACSDVSKVQQKAHITYLASYEPREGSPGLGELERYDGEGVTPADALRDLADHVERGERTIGDHNGREYPRAKGTEDDEPAPPEVAS